MTNCNCNKCVECRGKKKCPSPCGCGEPVFSIEAQSDDPTVLRFNVNGKSVWYDFDSLVKAGETCTTLSTDAVARTLNYHGECQDNVISAHDLGAILHLADIGDVNIESLDDYGILNYRKDANCGEGCEGIANGWVASNPVKEAGSSLDYILGSNAEGKMVSLMPPTDTSTFSYLAWAAQGKAKWVKPRNITSVSDNYAPLYLDKTTGEIVVLGGA